MEFNDTFNNISVISCRSIHGQTLSHNVVSSTPRLAGFELTTLVMIGTDCIGSDKSIM